MEDPSQPGEGRPIHRWKPIEDLPSDLAPLLRATAEVAAIRRAWAAKKKELEDSGALREFNARLARQWCIETGILEGIYTLDRGATQTLIEHGFDASLLSHGDTDVGEMRLIEILKDHERAIEWLFDFVKQGMPLTTSFVKQLHQLMTAHQDDCEGVDQFGNTVRVPLLKGEWKQRPNNPSDATTGSLIHEYCPPEHVAAEMDRLIAIHGRHATLDADLTAAWLHHRFTQIHPFQDGNGRIARALATLVLIQKRGFPFVVLRDSKSEYIGALRAADDGEVLPFVEFICRLQKAALLRAMGVATDTLTETSIDAIIQDAARRLQTAATERRDNVEAMAEELWDRAASRLNEVRARVAAAIPNLAGSQVTVVHSGVNSEHFFERHVQDTARMLGYQSDTSLRPRWVQLRIAHRRTANLIVSFHRAGSPDSGLAAISAFVLATDLEQASSGSQPCCTEPFTFTADRDRTELASAFDVWLERSLTLGLEIWRRSL